jgi:hypothetical protein
LQVSPPRALTSVLRPQLVANLQQQQQLSQLATTVNLQQHCAKKAMLLPLYGQRMSRLGQQLLQQRRHWLGQGEQQCLEHHSQPLACCH